MKTQGVSLAKDTILQTAFSSSSLLKRDKKAILISLYLKALQCIQLIKPFSLVFPIATRSKGWEVFLSGRKHFFRASLSEQFNYTLKIQGPTNTTTTTNESIEAQEKVGE